MTFLFWGFTAMWAAVAAYVWSLALRQRKLAEEVAMLDEVLKRERGRITE